MRAQRAYRFGGNIEAREIPSGAADAVCRRL
jgi:fatty acid/phospholipid biosynthesis enzyme